ncbi:MAG: hypothetical protein R3E88_14875 [Myxococcota bacterium]
MKALPGMDSSSRAFGLTVAIAAAWVAVALVGLVTADPVGAVDLAAGAAAPSVAAGPAAGARLEFLASGAVGAAVALVASRFARRRPHDRRAH